MPKEIFAPGTNIILLKRNYRIKIYEICNIKKYRVRFTFDVKKIMSMMIPTKKQIAGKILH